MSNNNNNIVDKLLYLNDTKQIIKQAIVNKGVEITPDTPFREYADKIGEISSGGGGGPKYLINCTTYGSGASILANKYGLCPVSQSGFIGTTEDISDYTRAERFKICHTFIANDKIDTWNYLGSLCPRDVSQMSGDYNGLTYEYGTGRSLKCLISYNGTKWDDEFVVSTQFINGNKYCFEVYFSTSSGYDFKLTNVSDGSVMATKYISKYTRPYNKGWSSGTCFGLSAPYAFPTHNSSSIHVLDETYFEYTLNGVTKRIPFVERTEESYSISPMTQQKYNTLPVKDSDTLYPIVEE